MDQTPDSQLWLSELSRIYDFSKSFDSMLDLPSMVREIGRLAMVITGTTDSVLYLTGAESHYSIRLELETASEPYNEPVALEDDPFASAVLETGHTVAISPDAHTDVTLPTTERHRLYIPLTNQHDITGVLGVIGPVDGSAMDMRAPAMLAGLAGYASIALENARLYQEALDRTTELAMLVESSNAVSSSLDLGSVLNAVSRHMMRGLDTHWCTIYGWEPDDQLLRVLAEHRLSIWHRPDLPGMALQDHPCFTPLLGETEKIPIQYNLSDADGHTRWCLDTFGFSRLMMMPLQAEGRFVGMTVLGNVHTTAPFTSYQMNLSQRFAMDLAPRLLTRRSSRWHRGQLVDAVRSILNATRADVCTLYKQYEDGTFRRLLTYGSSLWSEQDGPVRTISDLPHLQVVITEHRIAVLRSDDADLPDAEQALFDVVGPSAMLALPLVFKSKTVGLVMLHDIDPEREFTSREMALAHALANQAAIAIENAHLVGDLQRSLQELKAMQSRLVQAARLSAIGEMATVVAHQINNPLTTVIGDAELLVEDIPSGEPTHESAQAILRAGQRAKQVVERILTISRSDEVPHQQNVNDTIAESVALVGSQITGRRMQLDLDLAEDMPFVDAIPGQLEDVWMNLLINARDAIQEQEAQEEAGYVGRIELSSRATENDTIEVIVSDNGCGIEPDHVNQIFDPFYTTKPRGQGTGLGLYICRLIVTEHNGRISFYSTPGVGSRVAVQLPVTT